MEQTIPLVSQLLDHAAGKTRAASSQAHKTYLTLSGIALSLAAASLWGAAVGCTDLGMTLANAYKVPMVLSLSMLAAIPPALLWLRLSEATLKGPVLVSSAVRAMFAGTMWLGALSPLIGLYFYTSSWAGPALALGSVLAALISAFRVFARSLGRACESDEDRAAARMSGLVFCVLQLLVMWQLIVIVSPILPHGTVFSGGIDALWRH
jgi:hypothetical protein